EALANGRKKCDARGRYRAQPLAGLEKGDVLAWRYCVDEVHAPDGTQPVYGGTDEQTHKRFIAVPLTAAESAVVGPIQHVSHPCLAPILDLVESGEAEFLLVVEEVRGQSLESAAGSLRSTRDAAQAMLRIAEALAEVHRAGAVHGLLSPASVIFASEP